MLENEEDQTNININRELLPPRNMMSSWLLYSSVMQHGIKEFMRMQAKAICPLPSFLFTSREATRS